MRSACLTGRFTIDNGCHLVFPLLPTFITGMVGPWYECVFIFIDRGARRIVVWVVQLLLYYLLLYSTSSRCYTRPLCCHFREIFVASFACRALVCCMCMSLLHEETPLLSLPSDFCSLVRLPGVPSCAVCLCFTCRSL